MALKRFKYIPLRINSSSTADISDKEIEPGELLIDETTFQFGILDTSTNEYRFENNIASATKLGRIKIGTGLSIAADGTVSANVSSLSASAIPALDASKIATGVLNTSVLGTGTANNTTYLRGDGKWATVSSGGNVDPNTTLGYNFTISFDGNGYPLSTTSDLPAGWTLSVANTTEVTVNHTVGKMPKSLSYLGLTGGTKYRYRLPTAANEMSIDMSTKNSSFKFIVTSSVAGADTSSTAVVNLLF